MNILLSAPLDFITWIQFFFLHVQQFKTVEPPASDANALFHFKLMIDCWFGNVLYRYKHDTLVTDRRMKIAIDRFNRTAKEIVYFTYTLVSHIAYMQSEKQQPISVSLQSCV